MQQRHQVLSTWASNLHNYGGAGGEDDPLKVLCGGVPRAAEVEHGEGYVRKDGQPMGTLRG